MVCLWTSGRTTNFFPTKGLSESKGGNGVGSRDWPLYPAPKVHFIVAWGTRPGIIAEEFRAESPIHAMPQSLDNVLLHIVFSTKDRVSCLGRAVRPALHAYLATVARNAGCECPRVGGVTDHVHLAVQFSRTTTIAALVEDAISDCGFGIADFPRILVLVVSNVSGAPAGAQYGADISGGSRQPANIRCTSGASRRLPRFVGIPPSKASGARGRHVRRSPAVAGLRRTRVDAHLTSHITRGWKEGQRRGRGSHISHPTSHIPHPTSHISHLTSHFSHPKSEIRNFFGFGGLSWLG